MVQPAKPTKGTPISSRRQLARDLGWPVGTLTHRLERPDCPVGMKPPWPRSSLAAMRKWAAQLKRSDDANGKAVVTSPGMDRIRDLRARGLELDLAEREGALIPREDVHACLVKLSEIMRSVGTQLQRQFGVEALRLHEEGLDEFVREVEAYFSNGAQFDTAKVNGNGAARVPGKGRSAKTEDDS